MKRRVLLNRILSGLSDTNIPSRRVIVHKYEIDIFWSAEDDRYIAVVPDLPGCSAHGRTYKEALAEAEIAMAFWLEVAQEERRPIPKPSVRPVQAVAG